MLTMCFYWICLFFNLKIIVDFLLEWKSTMHSDENNCWVTVQECAGIPGFPAAAPNVRRKLEQLAEGNPLAKRKREGIKGYEYSVSILPEPAKRYFEHMTSPTTTGVEAYVEHSEAQEQNLRFGERLREAMGNESVLSFAKKCGLSDNLLGRYIKGITYPSIDKLPQIARASGKPISWFFGEKEAPKPSKLDRIELYQWWEMISKSMTLQELSEIVELFKEGGKKALLLRTTQGEPKQELSQSSINTALMLETLSPEARKEILAKYGINEQGSPVAPEKEPHKKAG